MKVTLVVKLWAQLTSHLQLYGHSLDYKLVDANSLLTYPKGQSKTCYQECGCTLVTKTSKCEWDIRIAEQQKVGKQGGEGWQHKQFSIQPPNICVFIMQFLKKIYVGGFTLNCFMLSSYFSLFCCYLYIFNVFYYLQPTQVPFLTFLLPSFAYMSTPALSSSQCKVMTRIKNIKNVTRCRDSTSAKSIETR